MSTPVVDRREQTIDVKGTGKRFYNLLIKPELVTSLRQINFIEATPIQEKAIPIILNDCDLVARAKNGTGKTGAFSIPMLNKLDLNEPWIQAIVLAHTRELAMQISYNIQKMGQLLPNFNNKVMCCIGGTNWAEDVERLRSNPLVIVGICEKVLSFINSKKMNISHLRMLVIDEADQQINNPAFKNAIIQIMRKSPQDTQRLLFSATFPSFVETFINKYLVEPVFLNCMESNLTLEGVTQYVAYVKEEKFKVKLLHVLFQKLQINQCIIFTNNIDICKPLNYVISSQLKMPSLYTNSSMSAEERSKIFHDFSKGYARVLVATDLYARGIDIRSVNVVINFNVPMSAEDYLHRIGRCGRFGHRGLAITLLTGEREINQFLDIENAIKSGDGQKIQIHTLPTDLSSIPVNLYACSEKDLQMR